MTRFALHVEEWESCTRCDLHKTRKTVVIGRGSLPCDALFVGEAPGQSEDVTGNPFAGPAGKAIDYIVAKAFAGVPVRVAFTNLVGCIPLDGSKTKSGEPEWDSVEACSPRLREFVELAEPRLIVCVGKLPSTWLNTIHLKNAWKVKRGSRDFTTHPGALVPRVEITHPAAILRANAAQQGLMVQRCIIAVRSAAEEHLFKEGNDADT